jgi:hypothetical protein
MASNVIDQRFVGHAAVDSALTICDSGSIVGSG